MRRTASTDTPERKPIAIAVEDRRDVMRDKEVGPPLLDLRSYGEMGGASRIRVEGRRG